MRKLINFYLLFCTNLIFSTYLRELKPDDLNSLKFFKQIESTSSDADVQLVADETDIFIFKQITDQNLDEQFLILNDLIASNFGSQNYIPVNNLQIIPNLTTCALKKYPNCAATVHNFISGISFESQLPKILSSNFTIQQRVYNPNSEWQKKYPVDQNDQGLTKIVIESMSQHKDLPKIVAFDTLIGNADRSLPNIIYKEDSNNFFGIDHAAAFTKRLPKLAIEQIQKLIDQNYFTTCSKEILESIKIYCDTLKVLATEQNCKQILDDLQNSWKFISEEINETITNRIALHSKIVQQNFEDCKKLILQLDTVLKK